MPRNSHLTDRMQEAFRSAIHSRAFKTALAEFAKLPREEAQFEIRLLELLFHEAPIITKGDSL